MLKPALVAGVVAACFALPAPSQPADTYDTCAGFIDTLPAVITTPGTWCLRKSLTTSISDGAAIDINADNVTLDCHGFRVTGLAGPGAGDTRGVYTFLNNNVTVRDCAVRGFSNGAMVWGSAIVVEDSRFENNETGISVVEQAQGAADSGITTVRRNRISDSLEFGINASGASVITDNIIDGVQAIAPNDTAMGIFALDGATAVTRNIVRNLDASASTVGIYGLNSPGLMIRDNVVIAMPGALASTGIVCNEKGSAVGNQVSGWTTNIACTQFDNGVTN